MFFGERLENFHAVADDIGWNGEPETLGWDALGRERHFRRTDSDQSSGNIDHRSAAVARINRCVRLHEIFVIYGVDADVALGCAQHSATDRASITDRVSDHQDGFA